MHSFALRYRLFTEGTSTAACSVNVLSASFCSYNCCVDFTLRQKGLKLEPFSISHIQNLCNFSDPLIDFIILPKKDIKSLNSQPIYLAGDGTKESSGYYIGSTDIPTILYTNDVTIPETKDTSEIRLDF